MAANLCACRLSSCLRVCAGLLSGFGPRLFGGWPSMYVLDERYSHRGIAHLSSLFSGHHQSFWDSPYQGHWYLSVKLVTNYLSELKLAGRSPSQVFHELHCELDDIYHVDKGLPEILGRNGDRYWIIASRLFWSLVYNTENEFLQRPLHNSTWEHPNTRDVYAKAQLARRGPMAGLTMTVSSGKILASPIAWICGRYGVAWCMRRHHESAWI